MQFFTHRRRGSALLISLLFIFTLVFCIPVSAREQEFKFLNWASFSSFYTADSRLPTSMSVNQRVEESSYLRLRFQPSFNLTVSDDVITDFSLTSTSESNFFDVVPYNNSYCSFVVEYQFFSVNGSSLTGNLFSGFSIGAGECQFLMGGSSVEGVLESANVTLNSASQINISCIYSAFIPSSVSGTLTSVAFQNHGILHLNTDYISTHSSMKVRVYYNLYPIIFSTGGQPLTGDEMRSVLDDYMRSSPSQPDYSSISEHEAAEQALAEALPDMSDAADSVLSGMNSVLGDRDFISAMHGVRYMLEEATSAGFLKFLLQFSISLGAIGFLVGLAFSVIRRS